MWKKKNTGLLYQIKYENTNSFTNNSSNIFSLFSFCLNIFLYNLSRIKLRTFSSHYSEAATGGVL